MDKVPRWDLFWIGFALLLGFLNLYFAQQNAAFTDVIPMPPAPIDRRAEDSHQLDAAVADARIVARFDQTGTEVISSHLVLPSAHHLILDRLLVSDFLPPQQAIIPFYFDRDHVTGEWVAALPANFLRDGARICLRITSRRDDQPILLERGYRLRAPAGVTNPPIDVLRFVPLPITWITTVKEQ